MLSSRAVVGLRRVMRQTARPAPAIATARARLLHISSQLAQEPPPQQPKPPMEQPASSSAAPEERKYSVKNYRGLEMPWLRVFLAAMLTYQLAYWSWEKMRTDAIVKEKTGEVAELENALLDKPSP